MTTQDVIEVLEDHSPDDTSELGEAIAFAVMILEKDIAQKAIIKEGLKYCPICKSRVFQDDNFCVDCGQRINWQKGCL